MTASRVIQFDEIDSTNAEARRRAEAGEVGPLWLSAGRQTAGRGRRGRVWESPTGNLAATYLFTTAKPPGEAAQVSFVAALAVHDVARQAGQGPLPLAEASRFPRGGKTEEGEAAAPLSSSPLGGSDSRQRAVGGHRAPRIALKWPNDLLINGRKAAGILVESGQTVSGLWVAVGIGVNLTVAPEPALGAAITPTSFRAERIEPPSPSAALTLLDNALQRWLRMWNADGFPAIAAAWTARAHGLGKTCTARLPAETVVGIAEGLDGDGALRLRLPDGSVRRITAGDVFFG